jgi:hypothetical protein
MGEKTNRTAKARSTRIDRCHGIDVWVRQSRRGFAWRASEVSSAAYSFAANTHNDTEPA